MTWFDMNHELFVLIHVELIVSDLNERCQSFCKCSSTAVSVFLLNARLHVHRHVQYIPDEEQANDPHWWVTQLYVIDL